MRFDLNRLLDGAGVSDVVTDDVDLSQYSAGGGFPLGAPVRVTARAQTRAGVVSLDCGYQLLLETSCGRCLAPIRREMTLTVPHTVVRTLQNSEEDDEYLVAPDGFVELHELAANDVIPELPSRFLCREDCKPPPMPCLRLRPQRDPVRVRGKTAGPPPRRAGQVL